jgi:hypothetical protein
MLRDLYPNWQTNQAQLKEWRAAFEHLNHDWLNDSISEYFQTCPFTRNPILAGILKLYRVRTENNRQAQPATCNNWRNDDVADAECREGHAAVLAVLLATDQPLLLAARDDFIHHTLERAKQGTGLGTPYRDLKLRYDRISDDPNDWSEAFRCYVYWWMNGAKEELQHGTPTIQA